MNTNVLKTYLIKIKNYKMTILDKFILSQVVKATLVCLVLFIIVWIAPETLFKIIKKVLNDTITPFVAVKLLILKFQKSLQKLFLLVFFWDQFLRLTDYQKTLNLQF